MDTSKSSLQISKKSFFTSVLILLILMLMAGFLTKIIPPGIYDRTLIEGRESIDPTSFRFIEEVNYPIYRWLLAPIEVLFSPDSLTVIVIIFFILAIGATFSVLDKSGMLRYLMSLIVDKFEDNKYNLILALSFFFMIFGAVFGIFEELVALLPITLTLSYSLGWDSLIGLGMSTLASGLGFASAIFNPFTLGIAQTLSDLPAFSGTLYRLLIFVIIYVILNTFLIRYAKKIEKDPSLSLVYQEDKLVREKYLKIDSIDKEDRKKLERASKLFLGFILAIILLIISSFFIDLLSDIALPLIAILFLIGGIVSGKASQYNDGKVAKDLWRGILDIAPAIILILMAMSVKLIITKGQTMDTILYYASIKISPLGKYKAGIFIYLLVLFLNFFIGSGSAKAFLIMPLIIPLTEFVGLTRQVAVQAFLFGDGFSNMLYPTNAVLMISLGLTSVSYPKWLKWTIKLQLTIFAVSILLLLLAINFNYGPF